ncbi:hypothetical protein [Pelagibius sp. Alg239-R121]|nr:hypothetical protein [Pelagibius sp. Alg239-R121]
MRGIQVLDVLYHTRRHEMFLSETHKLSLPEIPHQPNPQKPQTAAKS